MKDRSAAGSDSSARATSWAQAVRLSAARIAAVASTDQWGSGTDATLGVGATR